MIFLKMYHERVISKKKLLWFERVHNSDLELLLTGWLRHLLERHIRRKKLSRYIELILTCTTSLSNNQPSTTTPNNIFGGSNHHLISFRPTVSHLKFHNNSFSLRFYLKLWENREFLRFSHPILDKNGCKPSLSSYSLCINHVH